MKNFLLTPLKSLAGNAAGQASISAVQLPFRLPSQGVGVPQTLGVAVGLKQGQGDLAISGNNGFLGTKMSCERGACQSLEGAGVQMGAGKSTSLVYISGAAESPWVHKAPASCQVLNLCSKKGF